MGSGSATGESWYWAKQGSDERNGPVSQERLEELAEARDLELEDLVWTKGMDDWKKVGSVEKLKGLFETPPPLSDSGEGEKTAADDGPPTLSQNGDGEEEVEEGHKTDYKFPVEFDVSWKGLISSNESTLVLRKKEVIFYVKNESNHEGKVCYENLEIEEINGRDVKVTAPALFIEGNSFDRTTTLTFRSESLAKKAVKIIYSVEGKKMDIGDQLDTENTDDKEKPTEAEEGDYPFWYRHPVWTGVITLFLIGTFLNAIDGSSGGSSSGIHAADSISNGTAYMSHQLRAVPTNLSGRMLSGWKQTFSDDVGKDVYYAVEDIEEKEGLDIEKIRVLLTVEKCRDSVTGNTSTNVPSGALVIDEFDEILESSDSDAFIQSLTWQAEWQTGLLSRTGDEFDECSGSFE
ncbi:DUF4339 domain-containing protein [Salinibacter grassmerensis]|uniref:DUF4339 domain-containing protein n=1 Tax=Salinibacter grassmerensis TaxID=3040353 RepID=UPI0021E72456|nr:DUF4339 domain-containing protein [Salinibacter grassmerensis]